MKVTVVTPLFRIRNLDALEANIATHLKDHDWWWMIVADKTRVPSIRFIQQDCERVLWREYEGGDRWRSSVARNYANEIEDGWILNLDDDCLFHPGIARILDRIPPEIQVAAWQTVDANNAAVNIPGPSIQSGGDANSFGYKRDVLEHHTWLNESDADGRFFNRLRADCYNVAYFDRPGVYWNVNP